MKTYQNLEGKIFNRLKVLKKIDNYYYLCRCECGKIKKISKYSLISGHTKSCGCLMIETSKKIGKENKYKLRKYPFEYDKKFKKLYYTWIHMRKRCTNKKDVNYKNYGAKGIKVCKEWENFENFYIWAINNGFDENIKNHQCSIDRIDNNGDYEPDNCRWTNMKIQQRNRSNNRMITYNNETKCISEWAEQYNIKLSVLRARLKNKWDIESALCSKVKQYRKRKNEA